MRTCRFFGYVIAVLTLCLVHARLPQSSTAHVGPFSRVPSKYGGELHKFASSKPVELEPNYPKFVSHSENSELPVISAEKIKSGLTFGTYMLFWYFFTVAYNISNKNALMALPFPAFVVWAQLFISGLIILPIWLLRAPKFTRDQVKDTSVLSLLHTLGVYTSAISMQAGSISFLQIIKASEPVFVAAVSVLLGSRLLPLPVYLTLIPVIFGVALASVKDLSFTWGSFVPAVLSNTLHPLRMVLFKKHLAKWTAAQQAQAVRDNGIAAASPLSSSSIFQLITLLGVIVLLPIALITEGGPIVPALRDIVGADSVQAAKVVDLLRANDRLRSLVLNMLVSGMSYLLYNEMGFRILSMVHPVTHAVFSTVKRVVIIFAAVWMFSTPMSSQSIVGSAIAIAGTLLYSLTQQEYAALQRD